METTVEKLEAMFLKSKADLEYIDKRLKLDFINTAENGCPEENLAMMLENLRVIKAKHKVLCSQVKEITAAQKESMDSIRNNLSSVMELIQHFQQSTDVEVEPLTESVQESAEFLISTLIENTTEVPPVAVVSDHQRLSNFEYEGLSEALLKMVPLSIRSNIKLADLNVFYKQLQQHFSKDNSRSISVQKMKQLKMMVSDAQLKVLQHLSLIDVDMKGQIRLIM